MGSTGKTISEPYRFGAWDYEDYGMDGETVKETIQWFRDNSNLSKWEKSVDKSELQVLDDYTSYGYRNINKALRDNPNNLSDDIKDKVSKIDSAIDKFTLSKPMVVVREDSGEFLGQSMPSFKYIQSKVGQTIESPGYVSTNASMFGSGTMGADVTYHITVPSGRGKGVFLPTTVGNIDKGESEFLISRGNKYKVVSAYKDRFDQIHVNLKML